MERLHPMLVHFPIALLLFGVFCDLLRARQKTSASSLGSVGLWCTTAGVVMVIPVIGTGLLAHTFQVAPNPAAAELVNWHERLSYAVALWFGGLVAWRWDARGDSDASAAGGAPLPMAYRIAAVVGAVLLIVGAMLGGQLVYEHGMGVMAPGPGVQNLPTASQP